MYNDDTCINCGTELAVAGSTKLCPNCNSEEFQAARVFLDQQEDAEYMFIECPGASLYEDGTNTVVEGVDWHDMDDPTKGYRIVGKQIFAPTHTKYRRIRRDAMGNIRRCQGCQDYTVRMRRKEGPDFYIPSHKHPNRKKLKSVQHTTRP